MAIETGTFEPASFTIGDSVSWTRIESDYQAPIWNLVWGFYGPTRVTVVSTDYNTTDHKGTLPPTGWKPGRYAWTVKATNGTDSITLQTGAIDALPNLTAADADLDAAEAQLTLVETAYNALATKKTASVSVDGVSYTWANFDALKGAREAARREVERIKNSRRAMLGQSTGNLFVTRFLT